MLATAGLGALAGLAAALAAFVLLLLVLWQGWAVLTGAPRLF